MDIPGKRSQLILCEYRLKFSFKLRLIWEKKYFFNILFQDRDNAIIWRETELLITWRGDTEGAGLNNTNW